MKHKTLLSLLVACSLYATDGKEIFENSCTACHQMKMGWQLTSQEKAQLKAPLAFGITKHVRDVFPNEKQFVEFVSNYIKKPTRVQAKCRQFAIDKFGLMPPIGASMSQEEREAVAKYMFNNIGRK